MDGVGITGIGDLHLDLSRRRFDLQLDARATPRGCESSSGTVSIKEYERLNGKNANSSDKTLSFWGHYIKQGRILVDNNKLALSETWKPPLSYSSTGLIVHGVLVILSGVYSGFFNTDGLLDGIIKRKEN